MKCYKCGWQGDIQECTVWVTDEGNTCASNGYFSLVCPKCGKQSIFDERLNCEKEMRK